jgi:hypothetical protein
MLPYLLLGAVGGAESNAHEEPLQGVFSDLSLSIDNVSDQSKPDLRVGGVFFSTASTFEIFYG